MAVPLPSLKDVLELLDKWPAWKRIAGTPGRVDELEKRIATLEAKLAIPPKSPGRPCKACGEQAMRLTSSAPDRMFGPVGGNRETWTCSSCGHVESQLS